MLIKIKKVCILFVLCFAVVSKTNAQSYAGSISGALICCDTINSGFLSLNGNIGNVVTWLMSTDGGATWTPNGNFLTTQSYYNLKQTTCYKAVVKNGTALADTTLAEACLTVYKKAVGGNIIGGGSFCGTSGVGSLSLTANTGNVIKWENSTDGGNIWLPIANTNTIYSYNNLIQNIWYRTIVQNGSICLSDTSTIAKFTINPLTVAGTLNTAGSNTICYGTSAQIDVTGNVGNVLNWIGSIDNGLNWISISNTTSNFSNAILTQTTLFGARVQSANCKIDTTNYITINVLPQYTVNAGSDVIISAGQSTPLNGSGSGVVLWLPAFSGIDNSTIFNPIVTPTVSTHYILTVTDINSCVNSDTVIVTVLPSEFKGMVSSVFTPNNDGINDHWYIENILFYPENEVTVYNIFGNEVYSKKGYANDWQGTYNNQPLPNGTYFYVLKLNKTGQILKGYLDILSNK